MSSSKRQRVPAGLHAELSDYAHALRALRTNNALDVTSQLLTSAEFESDPELSDQQPRAEPVASGSTPSQTKKRPRKGRSTSKKPVDASNTWSRWPLPPDELKESEWHFSEEVQAIARQSRAVHTKAMREMYEDDARVDFDDATPSEDEDFDALDHSALVNMASDQLERILAALVSFAPAAAEQWANRFNGISWEAVLHAVSAAEIMDASIIERAQTRLEALYGPAELSLASRATLLQADARTVDEFEYSFDYLALSFPRPRTSANTAEKDEDDEGGKKKRGRWRDAADEGGLPPAAEDEDASVGSPDGCDSGSDIPLAQKKAPACKSSKRSASRTTPQSQPPEPMDVDEGSTLTTPGRRRSARLATPAT